MKLFILLVLSIFCHQAEALEGQELDCDDPKVFKAVDLALRVFNDMKEGHQFALVQILEARETDRLGTNLQVKYRLKETICAVGEGTWQECEFSREPDSGTCTAQIYQEDVYSSVSQTCTILRAPERVFTSTAICLGCWYPIPNSSLALLPIVRYTIREFNNQSDYPYFFEVGEISHAQQQVVSGMNYKFVYSMKETNCSKTEFVDLSPACKPIPGGRSGECEVAAYINITGDLVFATQDCKYTDRFPLHCFGCEQPISADDRDLRKALEIAIEKFNNESGDPVYYKLKDITRATTQLVAGINYRVACTLIKTNCTQEQHRLHQHCEPVKPIKQHICRIAIYVIPWRNLTYPKITCTKFVQPDNLSDIDHLAISAPNQRYIAGLTPFRKARHAEPRHVKHEHKKHKTRSSREDKIDQEETLLLTDTENTDQPTTIPREEDPTINTNGPPSGFPDLPLPDDGMEGSRDSPLFEPLPDLPEPTCPGKLWKPLKVSTTPAEERVSPTHRPVEDFDLLDALKVQN